MRLRKLAFFSILTCLCVMFYGNVLAEDKTAAPSATPEIEQRALDVLKKMCDYLASAKTMTYTAKSMVEAPVKGQLVHFWTSSNVTLKRPNALKISTKSDGKPTDVYFDGKNLTVFDPRDNMYAAIPTPATLDELFPFAEEKAGIHTTYSDLLTSDPFTALTDGLTGAFSAGQSNIGGVLSDHLAFKNRNTEWEIWISTGKNPLPVLMTITYLTVPDEPRFIVHFSNWKFNPQIPKNAFVFSKPAGATKIAFRSAIGTAIEKGVTPK